MSDGPHRIVNPDSLPPPVGFSHAVVAAPGRTVYLGGQAGHGPDGRLVGEGIVEQFDRACANVVEALRAAGGEPPHLTSIQIFVTEGETYRSSLREIGKAYREHFGKHYPALSVFEVASLFDPEAKVELVAIAVIPE